MAREKKDVVQFRWQADGKPDPQPELCNVPRDQLSLADFSDDELANYADMYGNRSDAEEFRVMMDMLNPDSVHLPRNVILSAVKDRIKWLSRQLAIAQGTYPSQEPKSILSAPISDLEGMVELLGEDTSASKALFGQKPLAESDYFHNMQRELSNRRGLLLWDHNVEHFLKHFRAKRDDINEPLRRETFVKTLIGMFPLVNKEKIRAALTIDIGLHNGAAYRWETYVRLCQDLLAEYKVYIPFDGDIVADGKLGNGFNVIAKSKYHCSGQAVQYPAGVVEDRVGLAYGGSPTDTLERLMCGRSIEGGDAMIRDGKTTRRIPTGFEVETRPAVALTDEETKNAHTLWFKESQELLEKIGMKAPTLGSAMMYNQRQSESRINRLVKNLSTQLIRDALGSAAKYPDRLVALRQVREAVDKAIALAQAEHLKVEAEAEAREAEDAKQGPMSGFMNFKTITVKDPSDDKKDE